ncbi:MAG: cyclic nucleotide-binding domain-containing protein [Planctomycetota bacterium]
MARDTQTINVLAGLSDDEIHRLETVCRTQSLEVGEVVFGEGDEGDDLYIVVSGRVRIAKAISLSVDRTLATLGAGGVFGELAMVGEGTRSATATAEEHTRLLVLARDGFIRLTEEEPVLGLKVMGRFAAALADRLRTTTQLLTDTVKWGLEVSGAASLDLHHVISVHATLALALSNGERVVGRLLKVERAEAGTLITLLGRDGQLHLVPFHAVVAMRLNPEILAPAEA